MLPLPRTAVPLRAGPARKTPRLRGCPARAPVQAGAEVLFQRRPMAAQAAGCDSHSMQTSSAPLKVFIAEDSAPIRDRVAAMLAARAMDVVGHAPTPQGSIDGIRAARPDVVVLDVQLEGGTGLEVLRALRGGTQEVAFVVFSNNVQSAYRKRYLSEGARRFLDKSTEFDQLAAAVEHASGRAH